MEKQRKIVRSIPILLAIFVFFISMAELYFRCEWGGLEVALQVFMYMFSLGILFYFNNTDWKRNVGKKLILISFTSAIISHFVELFCWIKLCLSEDIFIANTLYKIIMIVAELGMLVYLNSILNNKKIKMSNKVFLVFAFLFLFSIFIDLEFINLITKYIYMLFVLSIIPHFYYRFHEKKDISTERRNMMKKEIIYIILTIFLSVLLAIIIPLQDVYIQFKYIIFFVLSLILVIYFLHIHKNEKLEKENMKMDDKEVVYKIEGVRGRSIRVYKDKAVINVKVGLGSILTGNVTDGEKTIYYKDVISVQFKKSGLAIGYLQLETASATMNNRHDNFFNENSFTFDTTKVSNEQMEEVANYVKKQVETYKNAGTVQVNNFSMADEIRKYKELLDMGAITQEEFDVKKKELLK